jgi:N-acetylmuramoyl-L-alanine amidase/Bacterial SH3 domain
MPTVPESWMPKAAMERIHVHWTAGGHTANATDRSHYHIIVQADGTLVKGDIGIDANAPGSGMKRASHTLNANTGAIGLSMCCMGGAVESPFSSGASPMTEIQWNAMIDVAAQLAERYAIPVTPVTILTHAEVGPNLGRAQNGKWDVTRLSFDEKIVGFKSVGDRMRLSIAVALDALKGGGGAGPPVIPDAMKLPRFKVAGVAPSTLNFRNGPAGDKVGELPEGTIVERIALFDIWSQVRTPKGFVGWVATSFLKAM